MFCTDDALQLVGGSDMYVGRLEICQDGEWGTVCDDGWDTNDALVACRELGLPTQRKLLVIIMLKVNSCSIDPQKNCQNYLIFHSTQKFPAPPTYRSSFQGCSFDKRIIIMHKIGPMDKKFAVLP